MNQKNKIEYALIQVLSTESIINRFFIIQKEKRFLSLSSSPFSKFNERLVHERFPSTAMGFPQDQTPTISFLRPLSAMVNLIPGKSAGRRAFCIAITEPGMCVTFEYHVFRWIEKGERAYIPAS